MYNKKKCKDCRLHSEIVINGMAVCYRWNHDVWLESIACNDIDDVEPF